MSTAESVGVGEELRHRRQRTDGDHVGHRSRRSVDPDGVDRRIQAQFPGRLGEKHGLAPVRLDEMNVLAPEARQHETWETTPTAEIHNRPGVVGDQGGELGRVEDVPPPHLCQ